MNNFTAEEVRAIASELDCDTGREYPSIDKAMDAGRECCNAYADVLDRQAAGVTPEVIGAALRASDEAYCNRASSTAELDYPEVRRHCMRAALLAVWPVAAEPVAQVDVIGTLEPLVRELETIDVPDVLLKQITLFGKFAVASRKLISDAMNARAAQRLAQPRAVPEGLQSLFNRIRPNVEVAGWVYREMHAILAAPSQGEPT